MLYLFLISFRENPLDSNEEYVPYNVDSRRFTNILLDETVDFTLDEI